MGPPTSERVRGVTLDDLRAVSCVIGLAAGEEKVRGVLAALRTGVLDVLVLDLALAQARCCTGPPRKSPPTPERDLYCRLCPSPFPP